MDASPAREPAEAGAAARPSRCASSGAASQRASASRAMAHDTSEATTQASTNAQVEACPKNTTAHQASDVMAYPSVAPVRKLTTWRLPKSANPSGKPGAAVNANSAK